MDVLWWACEEDVWTEIALIMGPAEPGWLKHCLPASKNILDRMTEEEKLILAEEGNFLLKGCQVVSNESK